MEEILGTLITDPDTLRAFASLPIMTPELAYETLGSLWTTPNVSQVYDDLQHYRTEWNHPVYASFAEDLREQDEFRTNPIEVEEGVIQCGKCGGKRTISFQRQTRSADEGATTFSRCVTCGNRWRHNN